MTAQTTPDTTAAQTNSLATVTANASTAATKMADDASELASCIVVDSPAMYQLAASELQTIVTQKKKIEEMRLGITRPMDAAKQKVMDLFRGPIERLERAEGKIKQAMLTFRRAEDARIAAERAEAERKAREEREAAEALRQKAEADAEAARREAEDAIASGDTEAAAAAQMRVSQANEVAVAAEVELELAEVAPVTMVETSQATAVGIGTRENWKCELVSLKELVIAAAKAAEGGDETMLGYLTADMKVLGGIARALKRQARVPGVRFYPEAGLSVRSAA